MKRKPKPSDLQERFQVRLPHGLRDRLREVAELNGRSMNAEIVDRLVRSLEPCGRDERVRVLRELLAAAEAED